MVVSPGCSAVHCKASGEPMSLTSEMSGPWRVARAAQRSGSSSPSMAMSSSAIVMSAHAPSTSYWFGLAGLMRST